jgi:hypothetical protein
MFPAKVSTPISGRSQVLLAYPEPAPAVGADWTFNELARRRWNEQLAVRAALVALRGVPVASRCLRHLCCQRRICRQHDRRSNDNTSYALQDGTPRNVCRPDFLILCHVREPPALPPPNGDPVAAPQPQDGWLALRAIAGARVNPYRSACRACCWQYMDLEPGPAFLLEFW